MDDTVEPGGPTVRLRSFEEHDVAAVTAIYAGAVTHGTGSFEIDAPDEAEMARRAKALVEGGFPYLIAHSAEGEVLGYAYAGPYRSRPAYRFAVEDSIYVGPSARGKGVGRILLARLIAECEARGFRQMIAVIGDSANLASIGLHHNLGFRLTGVFEAVGWKHERWLDSVLMQRALGSGGSAPPPAPAGASGR